MGWNAQQNPGGYAMPAIRPMQLDPMAETTGASEARKALIARSRARIASTPAEVPIAANARKVDGFGVRETSAAL